MKLNLLFILVLVFQFTISSQDDLQAKKMFDDRFQSIKWESYYNDLPFNPSALSLYKWAPIAEDLKILDKKIVLNSVILKWDVIKKEFRERIKF